MRKRKICFSLISLGCVTGIVLFAIFSSHPPRGAKTKTTANQGTFRQARQTKKPKDNFVKADTEVCTKIPASEKIAAPSSSDRLDETIAMIQDKYGRLIFFANTQIQFIQELKHFIAKSYLPQERRAFFEKIIRLSFPEVADDIFAVAEKMDLYQEWLNKQMAYLGDLDAAEKDDLIWKKRRELFGEEADEIWAGMLRKRIVQKALAEIEKEQATGVYDKLDVYLYALQEAYQDNLDAYLSKNNQSVQQSFFKLAAVQDDLREMRVEERNAALYAIRKDLGMGEGDLGRSVRIDRIKAQEWQSGQTYLQQRNQLIERFDGADLENRLDQLRSKYWGRRAASIKAEEQAGFYRYRNPRVFGIN